MNRAGILEETLPTEFPLKVFSSSCPSRVLFDLVADKWSLMVLTLLGDGPQRVNALRRRIETAPHDRGAAL